MKPKLIIVTILTLIGLSHAEPVTAGGPFRVQGKWAGTAFASVIDLNGDGIAARTFDLRTYGQIVFTALQGVVDTGLVALPGQGSCADPTAIELEPFGKLNFRGHGEDVLFTVVDPDAPNLCFSAANPNELLQLKIVGGRGIYAGRTGTGTARIRDVVIEQTVEGFPLVIDTQGDFQLVIR